MQDNFKNLVDKFDSKESTNMNDDSKIIQQIARAAEVIGEKQLKKELEAAFEQYRNENFRSRLLLGIAASISICILGSVFYLDNQTGIKVQPLQMNEQPVYGDSAVFHNDTTKLQIKEDTLKEKFKNN